MARQSRQEHHLELVQDAILDAATRVFAESGYQAATMQGIAAEAGYSAPSLYNYFDGKAKIFEALVDRLHGELLATFDEHVPDSLSFEQRIELLLRRQLEVRARRRDAFQVFMRLQLSGGAPERFEKDRCQLMDDFVDRVTAWMTEALRHGGPQGHSPRDLGLALFGLLHAFSKQFFMQGDLPEPAENLMLIRDLFLHGAAGAPRASSKRSRS